MKEARIILPIKDNGGRSLVHEHSMLRQALVVAFEGYTYTEGHGAYVMADGAVINEPVAKYDVAVPDDDRSVAMLQTIAARVAFAARQEAVYLRLPDGTVEFVPPSPGRSPVASEPGQAWRTDLAEAPGDAA